MHALFCKSFHYLRIYNQTHCIFRHVRDGSKRIAVLKTLKSFKVETATDFSEFDEPLQYKDIAQSFHDGTLDLEEEFNSGADYETLVTESGKIYDDHISEEKRHKCYIKKRIIGRKYFQEGKETNLLTYAAKQQIRHLYEVDPTNWTPETLANSFPISVEGVKKLLKSNFIMTCSDKIKAHDEDVMKKWEILMSGEPTNLISLRTQILWKSNKLLRENYKGNPNLPNISNAAPKKPIVIKRKKTGEHAAILERYVSYKAKKESFENKNTDIVKCEKENNLENESYKHMKKSHYFVDGSYLNKQEKYMDENELPFQQFKENLKDELKVKSRKSPVAKRYFEWIEQDSKDSNSQTTGRVFNNKEFISEIPKYNKGAIGATSSNARINADNESIETTMRIKSKISIPPKFRNKKHKFKVGGCVYDENGEFLYKLPH